MIDEVIEIVNDALKTNVITRKNIETNLMEFGLDSLSMIKVIINIEKKFNCEIPDSEIIYSKLDTISKIYNVLIENIENTARGEND